MKIFAIVRADINNNTDTGATHQDGNLIDTVHPTPGLRILVWGGPGP